MQVQIINETGYDEALLGLALSYYPEVVDLNTWWTEDKKKRGERVALNLKDKTNDHAKYLRAIQVWMVVTGSRDFWQECSTYGVGATYLSASTMHTLVKQEQNIDSTFFEEGTTQLAIDNLVQVIQESPKDITRVKANLPEGFLQTRLVNINYMALSNIISQRKGHRLTYWAKFIDDVLKGVEHPELLERT